MPVNYDCPNFSQDCYEIGCEYCELAEMADDMADYASYLADD